MNVSQWISKLIHERALWPAVLPRRLKHRPVVLNREPVRRRRKGRLGGRRKLRLAVKIAEALARGRICCWRLLLRSYNIVVDGLDEGVPRVGGGGRLRRLRQNERGQGVLLTVCCSRHKKYKQGWLRLHCPRLTIYPLFTKQRPFYEYRVLADWRCFFYPQFSLLHSNWIYDKK